MHIANHLFFSGGVWRYRCAGRTTTATAGGQEREGHGCCQDTSRKLFPHFHKMYPPQCYKFGKFGVSHPQCTLPRILLSSKSRKIVTLPKNALRTTAFRPKQKSPGGRLRNCSARRGEERSLVLLWDSVQMLTRGLRSHCRGPHSSWPRHPSCNRTPCSGARDSSSSPCRCRHPVHGSRPHTAHGHCSPQT